MLRSRKTQTTSATPSLYGTVVQRVLAVPELLELIFSFLEEHDNASNARVCKKWSSVALDILWRNVDYLPRLVWLLAPTERHGFTTLFTRPLEPSDWTRFMNYASRVRCLTVAHDVDDELPGQDVFDEIARTRTSQHIFPKLTSFTWASEPGNRLRLSLMFMHENIKQFAVYLPYFPHTTYSASVYFQEIALRMPRITQLDLRFSYSVKEIESDLCNLFDSLPNLQTVIMPKFTLTNKVIETLSRKENLGVVQFEFLSPQGGGDPIDVEDWPPTLEEGAFPALYDLSVSVQLSQMLRFMRAPFFPTNLRLLYLHLTHIPSPTQVREFLTELSEACPLLAELYLDYNGDPNSLVFRNPVPDDERLTWDTLRPVLKCAHLTTLEVNWDVPLAITQSDIQELAEGWPSLQVLRFACEPLPTPEPDGPHSLTLEALLPFARHCPHLRELGLHLDARAVPPSSLIASALGVREPRDSRASSPFARLRELWVGASRISDPGAVALFLSQILPAACTVTAGVSWQAEQTAAETVEDAVLLSRLLTEATVWMQRWGEVDRVLPLLVRLRAEERARRDALEREVEDLRVRCRLMEERLGMGAGAMADSGCVLL